jgi:hypothetical protein
MTNTKAIRQWLEENEGFEGAPTQPQLPVSKELGADTPEQELADYLLRGGRTPGDRGC